MFLSSLIAKSTSAIEIPAKNGKTEWLEPVDDAEYNKLK